MIKIKRFKEFFRKIFWKVGENPFPVCCFLIIIALIFGGSIFHQYVTLAEEKEPQIIERPFQFREEIYQKILKEWERRREEFEEAEFKEYRDLFRVSPPPELTP